MSNGCVYEALEEGMRTVRAGFEFRVCLGCFEVWMVGEFDGFNESAVRAGAGYDKACFFEFRAECVGDFPSMTMTFIDDFLVAVEFSCLGAFFEFARVDAEAHGAAFFGDVFLVGHEIDDRIWCIRYEFGGVSVFHAAYVSCVFDDGALHAEAEAEERDLVGACVLDGGDLAFYAAVAEASWYDDAVDVFEYFTEIGLFFFDGFGVDPADVDLISCLEACMGEGFDDGEVCVVEFDVFADEGDVDGLISGKDAGNHGFPVFHVARAVVKAEFFEGDAVEAFVSQHKRYFIDAGCGEVVDDCIWFYVAEEGDLSLHVFRECLDGAAYDDVRLDADGAEFLDGVLGRLGFQFVCCFDVWHEGDVDVEYVISVRHVLLDLTDGFEEWQGFDIADGAADFGDDDVCIVIAADAEDSVFDFVGDVRDDLDGGSEVFAFSFFVDNGLVDFACCHVGSLGEVFVDETFIVAEVEIRFGAVVSDEYFAVLIRAHGAGVDVNIWIEFLDGDFVPSVFE